jgi:cell division protein FtsQ
MWDKPQVLNTVANLLLAATTLLVSVVAFYYVVRLPVFALQEVQISSPPAHVTREQIESIVQREIRGNFFTLDLDAIRIVFEKLPWVRKAGVRRHWPNRLEVVLEEHVPLARWNDSALVSVYGEVFEAAYDARLPGFTGPAGTAKEIAIQYEYFRRSLAVIDKVPAQVQVSARRAWQIRLEDGLTIELGRQQIEARLSRFSVSYERTLGRLQRRIEHVDLRYVNGFAVRIPELKNEKTEPRDKRGAA